MPNTWQHGSKNGPADSKKPLEMGLWPKRNAPLRERQPGDAISGGVTLPVLLKYY